MKRFSFALLIGLLALAQGADAVPRSPLDSAGKPDMSRNAAGKGDPKTLSDEQRAAEIKRVESYLSSISSVVSDFGQLSADGTKATGKFFLKRPGKMRWQYNPPTPVLLVSNGKVVTYYDAGLDQVTYVGVDDTLAGFIAQKDIRLESASTHLTNFEVANDGTIRATVVQKKKPTEGSLTLEFGDKPLQIKGMTTVDAAGSRTVVTFTNLQFGPVIDDKLFTFDDPRGVNHKRNKK